MSALAPSNWFPDERPGRPEIAIAAVVLLDVAYDFYAEEPIDWPWLLAGFLGCVIAWGPLAASPVGARVGDWFRGIGLGGRFLVILAFVVPVWAAIALSVVPSTPVRSAAKGVLLGVVVVVTARLLQTRVAESPDEG
ncbi:hypothetical protein [Halorientalis pallida]|uniref:Uncharacterized protein n=1 Tax=Halorientalis pallida TaxID=2479928 RepID=A0A498KWZ9_9EURY|nr:hypothetical protein [Halorientalis pallida]RXK50150.1 hypothetical protein EAF64_06190 [Halorientalis pallida]